MTPFAVFAAGDAFSPQAVLAACFEHGHTAVLIDRDALPDAFFDLRTGLAGELAQRVTLYGVRLACVVPDLASQPERFRESARESNEGRQIRFAGSRAEAEAWLTEP